MNGYMPVETGDEVLAAARAAVGFTPSEKQRKDWRAAGLLPGPLRQAGRGRGRGSVTLYPPGTGALLAAICRHSRPKKPLAHVAMLVWWDGYRLPDEAKIREMLDQTLSDWEGLAAPWVDIDAVAPEEWAKLDQQLGARLPPHMRIVMKRAGKGPFRYIAATMLNMAAGGFDGFRPYGNASADEARADAIAALGVDQAQWVSRDITAQFSALSAVVKPATLREVLRDATDADLEQARDEVRDIVNLIDNVSRLAARLGGNGALTPFEHLDGRSLTPGMLAGFVLFWLSASRQPVMRANFRRLQPTIEAVSTLRQLLDATESSGTKKPPRRLEPSGGTTQGGYSPCRSSLAPPPASPRRATAS